MLIRRAIYGVLCPLLLLVAIPASADESDADRARCKASYERVQVLMRDEHFEDARAQLALCEQTCPAALGSDCRKWSNDLESLTPTVRLAVTDRQGSPLPEVRVTVDGKPLDAPLARPIKIEPGTHAFVFEHAGFGSVTTTTAVHAGERDKSIVAVMSPLEAAPPEAPPARTSATASYVVGGVGVTALVAAGVLAIKGHADRSALVSQNCAPRCDPGSVNAIATEWWVSAGLAAGGVIGIGIAVVLWPRADHAPAAMPALSLSPRTFAATWNLP
ncbi:MAG: hypothetical protein ABIP89_00570 [Polyangiaceae bacterium]